ncbi:hypothetical protein NBRC116590_02730 [Pelagimonas sp. KU-00592-HH]|uniref:hypothetical protein n=1 Tax=Pelagimonas sp. KU-00592-HH TaxID=3127651 RepID=UPI00310C5856
MKLDKLSPRLAANSPATLHLKDPATGERLFDGKTPVSMEILGADSDALEVKQKDIASRQLAGENISEAQSGAEMLASITVGWTGIGLHSDEELPFTFENAVRLYLDKDSEWICGQVGPFSRDRKNFVTNRQKH